MQWLLIIFIGTVTPEQPPEFHQIDRIPSKSECLKMGREIATHAPKDVVLTMSCHPRRNLGARNNAKRPAWSFPTNEKA